MSDHPFLADAQSTPSAGTEPPVLPLGTEDVTADSLGNQVWLYAPSWLASTVVHLLLVLLLALLSVLTYVPDRPPSLDVTVNGDGGIEESQLLDVADLETDVEVAQEADPFLPAPLADLPPTATALGPIVPVLPESEIAATGAMLDAEAMLSGVGGNSLAARLDEGVRHSLLTTGGGTPQSEEAVRLALNWLVRHQLPDGSWSFQHQKHPDCNRQCGNPGSNPTRIAATGLALLPFLGTGQTHFKGEHKETVERGLKYLVKVTRHEGTMGSLWDPSGNMYGHGLASIAICEAYGMSGDLSLRKPAQSVVNFIVAAQDPKGGGWRYQPKTPGDTSVVGWQIMALKSAEMADLVVPKRTFRKAGDFLDSVDDKRGAVYGYQQPDARRPSTSAIGLLCRMYLGWDHNHRGLTHGVRLLSQVGPSINDSSMRNNLYYDYYATQVLHHWGGSEWRNWNEVMREYLIKSQSRSGHELGSWFFDGADHGSSAGGRLYCTAMSAMILEVYYRHMPLYRNQSLIQ